MSPDASAATIPLSSGPRPGPWQRMARGGGLLDLSGRLTSTIFEEMTVLAQRTGAVNLGQGFPDFPTPRLLIDAATTAMSEGHNQYAPIIGVPALRDAVVDHQRRFYGLELDPQSQVTVCAGATEGLAAALLSILEPGDEVVLFEPHYDAYGAIVAFAGATAVPVPLLPPTFTADPDDVRRAFSPKTRAVVVNDPHNPTGTVAEAEFKELVVALATEYDAIIVTDEVYEHLRFDGPHIPISTLPGAGERTLSVSSAGKTFSATGWRVGWVTGPQALLAGVTATKAYLSHSAPAPLQHAVAEALAWPREFFTQLENDYRERRDVLLSGLKEAGLNPSETQGTFFTVADVSSHFPLAGVADAAGLAQEWATSAGVVAIPMSAFASEANKDLYSDWLRFAFCKRVELLRQAMASLGAAV